MAPRTQRKVAVIWAADAVGYSRLVGDDGDGTIIATVSAIRSDHRSAASSTITPPLASQ
jgi:hypothetical protein